MSEAELETFKKMLRSVLLTSKDGVPAFTVEAEYRSLVGEDIPYRKFGFHSVQDFILERASDAAKLKRNNDGENVFIGVGTEETKRIEKLVQLQKTSKKKKKHPVVTRRNPMLNYRNMTHFSHRQPRSEISHSTHYRQNQATGESGSGSGSGSADFVVTRGTTAPAVKSSVGFPQNVKNKDISKLTVNMDVRPTGMPRRHVGYESATFSSNVARDISNNNIPDKRELPPRFQQLNLQRRKDLHNPYGDTNQTQRKSVFDRLGLPHQVLYDATEASTSTGPRKLLANSQSVSETVDFTGAFPQYRPLSSSKMETKNTQKVYSPHFQDLNSPSSKASSIDEKLLSQRISQLLETYPSGIWLSSLSTVYENAFKMKAPSFLENSVETWTDLFLIENVGFKKMVKSKVSAVPQAIKPAKLQLKDEWEHDVYVSYVRNAGEIVIRILGDQHSILLECLEEDYGSKRLQPIDSICNGLICLVANESDVEYEDRGKIVKQVEKCYNRVEVVSVVDDHHMVKVEYLDHGGSEDVDKGRLFSMPGTSRLPCQAIHCVLDGLEDLKEDEHFTELLLKDLPAMCCLARGKRLSDQVLVSDSDLFSVTLIRYGDANVKINELLRAKAFGPPTPKLNEVFNASVASVGYNGLVYLHVWGPGLIRLNSLLNAINWLSLESLDEDGGRSEMEKLTLVMFSGGCQWRRVKVLEVISKTEVFVQDADFGDVYIVCTSNLRVLSPETHQELVNFPHQAMCCILSNLPESVKEWTPDAYLHLSQKLLSKAEKVKAKIIGQNEKQINIVELWLSSDKSVSDLMISGQEVLWAKPKPCKLEPLSSGDEVFITDCQDPGNFKGFSKSNFMKVEQMMSDLQDFYQKFPMSELVPTFDSLSCDILYAVKLSDYDPWHRASIVRIMNKNMISVRFVDFGHYYVIQSINKVRHLPSDFLRLPPFSHEMCLSEVCHDNSKWSEQDTETLRKLILNKTFRVFLSNKTVDKSQQLPVTLINTCTCDNPFVSQILLQLNLVTSVRSYHKS